MCGRNRCKQGKQNLLEMAHNGESTLSDKYLAIVSAYIIAFNLPSKYTLNILYPAEITSWTTCLPSNWIRHSVLLNHLLKTCCIDSFYLGRGIYQPCQHCICLSSDPRRGVVGTQHKLKLWEQPKWKSDRLFYTKQRAAAATSFQQ